MSRRGWRWNFLRRKRCGFPPRWHWRPNHETRTDIRNENGGDLDSWSVAANAVAQRKNRGRAEHDAEARCSECDLQNRGGSGGQRDRCAAGGSPDFAGGYENAEKRAAAENHGR